MNAVGGIVFESRVVGPFGCNCVILGCERTREALVIDPGDEPEKLLSLLEKHRLKVRFLLHTHAHLDHIGATAVLRSKTGAATCLHEGDLFLAERLPLQASLFGLPAPDTPPIDRFLEDGEFYTGGGVALQVIHTPGHTPGSVSFFWAGGGLLLTGDTLFAGSVGRTDLWGGSSESLLRSIRERLMSFPDSTRILPGHGPSSSIGQERRANPFLQERT